ncbi:MAG: tyrosine-type recombinase/integrase [Verrucomicrobiales bacterium]|jgi:integrase|nr:tyrosine-type recombinase/integrase [Verrucomicrobiales bacterium]
MSKGREIFREQGVSWTVWPTKQRTWKAYAKIADKNFELHRATKSKIIEAARDKTRGILGYDAAGRWGTLEAWQEWRAAQTILERCGGTIIQAAEFYEANRQSLTPAPVAEAVQNYLASMAAAGRESEWAYIVGLALKNFTEFVASRKLTLTAQINTVDIEAWLAQWRGKTRNDKLGTLKTFLKFCRARGMVRDDEALTASIARSRVVANEVTVLSPAMLRDLWRAPKPAAAQCYLAVAAGTGARQSEIFRLAWPDVRFAESCVVLAAHKTKTASRRLVPLTTPLKSWLAAQRVRTGPVVPKFHFETLTKVGKRVLPDGWPRNVLRHSWISYRVVLTGNVDQVAIEAGNSRQKIFSNYRAVETIDGHPVTKALAAEWFSLISV